jgi:ABC-2 type transport system permease protein
VPTALVVILSLSYVSVLHWPAPTVEFLPFTAGQQLVHLGGEANAEFFGLGSGGVFILAVAWTPFTRRDA